jgi:hypothetical protein
MIRSLRALSLALIPVLALAAHASAQQLQQTRPGTTAHGQCRNNLKQIGLAVHYQSAPTMTLAAGQHRVEVCQAQSGPVLNIVDGPSNTVLISEAQVQLRGCPADMEDFGEATVRTRERADGATEVILASREQRGCTAQALLLPAVQKVREAAARMEPDTRRVSPATGRAYATFWRDLPRREAATLDRQLQTLATRAQRGENVDRELARTQAAYPQLFELSQRLEQEPLVLVSPDGGEEPYTCIGVSYIDKEGKIICIGVLID